MQNLHHFTHRVDIQVYSVLQKFSLVPIRLWYVSWESSGFLNEVIIARRVVLTNLITNFSKMRAVYFATY